MLRIKSKAMSELFNIESKTTNIVTKDAIHYYIDVGATNVITTLCDRYINIKHSNKYTKDKSIVTCKSCKKRKEWKLI